MTDALFSPADVYDGDPLNPDMETPTPGLACGNCITRGQMTFDEGDAA